MGKLDVKSEKSGDRLNLTLAGTIDEDIDFNQIPISGHQKIDVQMSGIKSINSCGIREWIKWMGTAAGAEITWHECPKVIVDQINMVDGFLPMKAKVMSFFVPYYNDEAGSEKNILFRYGNEFKEGSVNAPESVKDEDGNDMEMDIIESKYFKFIKK